jgi:sulfate transport system ATP-binding protein
METPYLEGRSIERTDRVDIRVTGIVKEFGDTAALHDVSLDVRHGELMALLGPSGSGKTTLLRVIAGLEIADRGRIFFGDQDATTVSVQRRRVGFVFQQYALFKHLTVFDNIAYGLRALPRAQRPSAQAMRARVLELLELVQLPGLERRFPAQLSGGQRQRVALARALAVDPQVLLLDEPFGALDAKVRKDLRRWLRDLHRRSGQTTIFVTHDQDEALELADRVAILNKGRIEQIGTPDDVHEQPASPFVMGFVGDTSRLPVRLCGGRVWHGDRALDVPVSACPDAEASLYIRPWDVAVGSDPAGLAATIHAVRRVGSVHRLEVILRDSALPLELDGPADARPGDAISLRILRGKIFTDG